VWEAADDRANSGFSLDEMFEHARTITDPNGNPTGTGSLTQNISLVLLLMTCAVGKGGQLI
jgi:hypothetical protein